MQSEKTNGMESIHLSNPSVTTQYWNVFKQMSDVAKLDLIMMLTQSLKHDESRAVSANEFYGIWADENFSADEAAEEIKSLRSFNHKTVRL